MKIKVVLANKEKYSISAMCKFLKVARSTLYYKSHVRQEDVKPEQMVQSIFKSSINNYGARKIKVELNKAGYIVSRRKIRRMMNDLGLVSKLYCKTIQNS